MNVDDAPAPKPVFNNAAVTEILEETGLSLAKGMTTGEFQEALEEVACEHYWNEFTQPAPASQNSYISFDALAGPSVTPSRLKSRLVGIERSAKRVFKGTSRRPFVEKVEELLNRLGRHRNGRPLKFSGTETPGHGGSERSAVWLCLIRAIYVNEAPPQRYRPKPQDRPWASQKLEDTIQTLVGFARSPDLGRKVTEDAARVLHGWARWGIQLVETLLATNMKRHKGEIALDITLTNLATVYRRAFDKKPSLYKPSPRKEPSSKNSWGLFFGAVLNRILAPDDLPSTDALLARWRHLTYAKR